MGIADLVKRLFHRQTPDVDINLKEFCHTYNPLSLYSRLIDIGMPKNQARNISLCYEASVFNEIRDYVNSNYNDCLKSKSRV